MLAKEFEDFADMLRVFLLILTVDEDVINIDNDEFVQIWSEDVLNQSLKGGRSIGEAKGHDFELVMSIVCSESCFLISSW